MRTLTTWLVLLTVATPLSGREWSDRTGAVRVTGELVAVRNGKVYLEDEAGQVVKIPFVDLRRSDQDYIQQLPQYRDKSDVSDGGNAASAEAKRTAAPLVTLDMSPDVVVGEVQRFTDMGWGVKSLVFSPNGAFLAAGKLDDTVQVFDVRRGRRIVNTGRIDNLGQVTAAAFSPNGRQLLTGGYRGRILVWDFAENGLITDAGEFAGHSREVRAIFVAADGAHVLSGSSEKRARFWELKSGREEFAFDGFEGAVNAVFITRSGRQGLATDGRTLALLDLVSGKTLQTMQLSGSYHAPAAFSPDGKRVAVMDGRQVRLWDIKSGREFAPLTHTSINTRGCVFSPNGRYLLTGSSGMAILWDAQTSQRLYEFDIANSILPADMLAYAPDGRHFAALPSSAGQALQVFRVAEDVADPQAAANSADTGTQ